MVTVDEEREDAFRKTSAGQSRFKDGNLPRRVDPEKLMPVRFEKPYRCATCGKGVPLPDGEECGACRHRFGHRAGCGCPWDPACALP